MNNPTRNAALALATSALLNGVGSVSAFGLAVITATLLARALGPERYGDYILLTWMAGVASSAMALGVPSAITRLVAEADGRLGHPGASSLATFGVLAVAAVALPIGVLLAIQVEVVSDLFGVAERSRSLVPLVAVVALASSVSVMASAFASGLQKFGCLSAGTILKSVAHSALALVALHLGANLGWLLASSAVASALGALLLLTCARRAGIRPTLRGLPNPSVRLTFVRHAAIATAILGIQIVVWDRSEVFFLGRLASAEAVGYYSLAYTLVSAVCITGIGSLAGVLTPHIAHQTGAGSASAPGQVFTGATRYLAALALPVCAYGIAVAPVAVPLAFGERFGPVVPLVGVLFPGGALGAVGLAASATLYGTGTHSVILRLGLPLAVLNVLLDLALIPERGAIGAALANTTTQAVAFVVGTAYVARLHRARYPLAALLKAGAASAVAFGVARAVTVYSPTLAGVGAAAVASAVAYLVCLAALGAYEPEDRSLALGLLRRVTVESIPSTWRARGQTPTGGIGGGVAS